MLFSLGEEVQEEPLCCSGGAALTHRGRRPAGSNAAALDDHIWASNAGQDTTLDTLLGITLSKNDCRELHRGVKCNNIFFQTIPVCGGQPS